MIRPVFLAALALTLHLLGSAAPLHAQNNEDLQLPELGDSTSGLISLEQEYVLGRAWLMALRSQVTVVADPLLQDYLENLSYNLASHSQLKDRRLDLVVIDNPTMNAFAVPGGVIGVHTGLFNYASTEAQFASVMTHEIAHVSQRHFARGQEAAKRANVAGLAGMLAGIVLAATAGGDAGLAAMTAGQAASMQSQLRYSRLHEQEADRIGIQTLFNAGMDPNAAPAMFDSMLATMRFAGSRPPEFLLTHPVTESRVSDGRNRARQYPRKVYTDNIDYQLMRARASVITSKNPQDAAKRFRSNSGAATTDNPEASRYGLVLALIAQGDLKGADAALAPLRQSTPDKVAYITAAADIAMASGRPHEAIKMTQNALAIAPGSHPLTMTLANAYLKADEPHLAAALLKEHTKVHPNDPSIWYLLAEAQGLAGDIVGVHQARAEYFVLNGALDYAQKQLSYALPLVQGQHLTTTRIQERIAQIETMKETLKNL